MNFLLTGTYSSHNKGDAAMQLATGQALRKKFPGATVTISAPFAETDRHFYEGSLVVQSTRRRLIWGSLQGLRAWLFRKLYSWFRFNCTALIGNRELRAFHEADVVVDLSGDTLTEDYGPHVTYSHFLPILQAMAIGTPVFVCAQSIGPFKLTNRFARMVLNRVAAITVRDEITQDYLRELGASSKVVGHTADMAFLLEPAPADKCNEILDQEGIIWPDAEVLGVSVSNLIAAKYDHAHTQTTADGFVETCAELLDRVVRELGAKVLFVGHVTGPKAPKDDRLVAKRILDKMDEKSSAMLLKGNYGPEELKAIIGRCHVFLGCRMHANIGALSMSVPVVAISYSHKTPGIMRMFNQEKSLVEVTTLDPERLFRILRTTWGNRDAVSREIAARLVDVKKRAEHNVEVVLDILGGSAS